MVLTLEILTAGSGMVEVGARQVFSADGGTIGRKPDNTWVLPDSAVSSEHARIGCQNGVFRITDDHSTNGVFVNSATELERGVPRELHSGDTLFIGPYEIGVSVVSDDSVGDPFSVESERLAPEPELPPRASSLDVADGPQPLSELDPLKALDLGAAPARTDPSPPDNRLHARSPLEDHYHPATPAPPPHAPAVPPPASSTSSSLIPDDYDPLAPDREASVAAFDPGDPFALGDADADAPEAGRVETPVAPDPPRPASGAQRGVPRAETSGLLTGEEASSLAAMLEGAGLHDVTVTPELARSFGQILRVVVAGVMDIDRTRQDFKHEFRMDHTRMQRVGNNPLKYSASVDDALHNVLLKRGDAFIGPVEAFQEVFDDLRRHQIAVLAGLRVAFESTLAAFDPARIEAEVDRSAKGPLPNVLPKSRYWDQYCEKSQEMAADPETTFRKLFGEALAEAYEEQVAQLQRSPGRQSGDPK